MTKPALYVGAPATAGRTGPCRVPQQGFVVGSLRTLWPVHPCCHHSSHTSPFPPAGCYRSDGEGRGGLPPTPPGDGGGVCATTVRTRNRGVESQRRLGILTPFCESQDGAGVVPVETKVFVPLACGYVPLDYGCGTEPPCCQTRRVGA